MRYRIDRPEVSDIRYKPTDLIADIFLVIAIIALVL
jgi:hypothetical protein